MRNLPFRRDQFVFGLAAFIAAGFGRKRQPPTSETAAAPSVASPRDAIAIAPSPPASRVSAQASNPSDPFAFRPAAQDISVSELSRVTDEAEVYLALNRTDRAIAVLRDHIRREPRSLPATWLLLLDIYRRNDRKLEFRSLAVAFHKQFNAQAPKWSAYSEVERDDGLEGIPRLLDDIVSLWGTPQCVEYLERLLYDNRRGQRTGFSSVVYEDLLLLLMVSESATGDSSKLQDPPLRPAWAVPVIDREADAADRTEDSPLAPADEPATDPGTVLMWIPRENRASIMAMEARTSMKREKTAAKA